MSLYNPAKKRSVCRIEPTKLSALFISTKKLQTISLYFYRDKIFYFFTQNTVTVCESSQSIKFSHRICPCQFIW